MPRVESHPAGALCWADVSSADLAAAAAFYGDVVGWKAQPADDPSGGQYHIFRTGNAEVAALSSPYLPGDRTGWTTYFAVADVDAAAAAAVRHGGTHLVPPDDVPGLGRTATLVDPVGAVFAVWQAYAFTGSALTGEPATLHGAELLAPRRPRVDAFYAFYAAVLGRVPRSREVPDTAPHWLLHLAVADHAEAAQVACRRGGSVVEVRSAQRSTTLLDPEGSPFCVSEILGA